MSELPRKLSRTHYTRFAPFIQNKVSSSLQSRKFDSVMAITASALLHVVASVLLLYYPTTHEYETVGQDRYLTLSSQTFFHSDSELFRQRVVNVEIVDGARDSPLDRSQDLSVDKEVPPEASSNPVTSLQGIRMESRPTDGASLPGLAEQSVNIPSNSAFTTVALSDGPKDYEDELRDLYLVAVRNAVLAKWDRPDGDVRGCVIELDLLPGGQVLSAKLGDCPLSVDARNRLESAALMAQPLPYHGYELVFRKSLNLRFID